MTNARHVVLLFGEILIDRFPDREVLGGAPFNVARHLCAFGCAPVLVTRIGLDEAGARILQVLESSGLATHGVQLDSIHSTGVVQVRFTSDGNHWFDILPDQAYDHIHPRLARIAAIAAKPELVYFGTLAQRSDSHRALRHMLRAVRGQRFFDVNLRNPWVYIERLHWSLNHADIVKTNDAELEIISQLLALGGGTREEQARLLMQRYSLRGVLITGGAAGAWWLDNSSLIVMPFTPGADIRDTVGAGDAFSAVFILGLLHGWEIPVILRRAHHFAGAICQIRGAVPELDDFYEPFIDKWIGPKK